MITAIIIAAASPQIGGGHVMRCLGFAESLERHGFNPVFAVSKVAAQTVGLLKGSPFEVVEVAPGEAHLVEAARNAGVVIFDGYDFDCAIELQWRDRVSVRIAVDDLANRRHECELLVDPSPGRGATDYAALVPDQCAVLTGASYALLRREFRHLRERALRRRSGAPPRRLLISMGATDFGGVTRRVVEGILLTKLGLEIDVVVGHKAASLSWLRSMASSLPLKIHIDVDAAGMAELMVAADMAIGGGGGTGLERCCMGLPSLVIVLAENQRFSAENLERAGAATIVDDFTGATPDRIASALSSLAAQGMALKERSRIAASIVDGNGADRVCQAILQRLG